MDVRRPNPSSAAPLRRSPESPDGRSADGMDHMDDSKTNDQSHDGIEVDIHATLDTVGLLCPAPIMKTAEKMDGLQAGEVLEVLSDDPGVEIDMPAWCRGTGHELLEMTKSGTEYRILIRKEAGRP